ncbi:protocatechuate 3,4-dioxygenase subunit alpha [Jannaschia sp. CCS1]|uniref:protocatechuate 3,4-dioxygenase subunit alpha n=1 Tax=Jannaschia sp. (strain CCS1) TaxID=290400 RepID=UPI000053DBA8|nr:protocatechuate 3,4-dioxygenase subunit alpha [Jannaschia sp. CCS1]ABD57081.1 protocatechuate 3,4-dioxygenase, alpha subunit [Jannaschia sp. CCS1]
MSDLKETPSQTAGPYVHIGLATEAAGFTTFPAFGAQIFSPDIPGERIRVGGRILDGDGAPMTDALLEIWQADASGTYSDSAEGFGRIVPDFETGAYGFDTIKPGATNGAPHLHLWLVARGINLGLHTRMYFEDEGEANAADPVLQGLDLERRATLIAARDGTTYRLDIRVQGDNEMVFFDV